jgi:hypothetical protein
MHFHALCVQPHVALAVCCLRCWGSSSRVVCRVYQAVTNADLPCGVLPPVLGAVAGPLSACHDGARLSPQCVSICSMWGLLSALRAASNMCVVCAALLLTLVCLGFGFQTQAHWQDMKRAATARLLGKPSDCTTSLPVALT